MFLEGSYMLFEFAEHQVATAIILAPPIRVWYKHYIRPNARVPNACPVPFLPRSFDITLEKQRLAKIVDESKMFYSVLPVPHDPPMFNSADCGVCLNVIDQLVCFLQQMSFVIVGEQD